MIWHIIVYLGIGLELLPPSLYWFLLSLKWFLHTKVTISCQFKMREIFIIVSTYYCPYTVWKNDPIKCIPWPHFKTPWIRVHSRLIKRKISTRKLSFWSWRQHKNTSWDDDQFQGCCYGVQSTGAISHFFISYTN